MNKQDILNQRRKKLLKRIEESAEGRAYLAERNDPTGTGLYVDSVKKMQMEEIAKVEKIMDSISRVNESAAVLKEIRSMHGIIKELAEKKIPAPVVNYQPAEIRVKVPEPTVINQTKTEVLVETKHQEKAAEILSEQSETLKKIAKNTGDVQVARIKNAFNDPIPVQLVDKRGKAIMDFSDIPAFMSGSTTNGSVQYTEGDVKTTTVGTMMMWKSGSTVKAASTAEPLPVAIISGAGSGGTAMVDDAAFTVGTTSVTPVAGIYKATRDSVDDGDAGAVAMTAKRAQFVTLETPDGDSVMDETLNVLKVEIVDGAGAQITTFGGGTQYTEGDIDASITGTAMMWEDTGNTLRPVSASTPLPVDITDSTIAATQSGTWSVAQSGSWTVSITGTPSVTADTELPAAASLADNTANPSTTSVGTFPHWFDGVTWDRAPGTAADGLLVNLGANNDVTVTSSALPSGAATAANQTTIIGHVDGIEALLTTIDADTSVLSAAVSANKVQVDVISMPTTTVQATNLDIRDLSSASDSVAAAQSGTWTVQPGNTANTTPWLFSIHDGTTKATVRELGTNDALNVAITDGSGNQITSFGGGTQYAEDDAAAANPTGTAPILVRQDTPAGLVSADGDNVAQRGTNYGAAFVQIVSSSGSFVDSFGGGTQYTEGDIDTTITGTAMMWEDASDTLRAVSASKPLPVDLQDATVAVTQSGTWTVDTELPTAAALADATANPTTTNVGAEMMVFNGTTWDRSRSGTTTPSSTFTGMQNTMPWAKYDSTPTARTTGQGGPLQADVNGALQVNSYTLLAGEDQTNGVIAMQVKPISASTYTPTRYTNFGSSTAANVKSSTGNVFACTATNTNAAIRYLQLHNTSGTPAASATPIYTFLIPASGMITIGNDFFTNAGGNFSTGIGVALSTTAGTYTAATAGDHMTMIHYA